MNSFAQSENNHGSRIGVPLAPCGETQGEGANPRGPALTILLSLPGRAGSSIDAGELAFSAEIILGLRLVTPTDVFRFLAGDLSPGFDSKRRSN